MIFFKLFYFLKPGKLTVVMNILDFLDATQARTTKKFWTSKLTFWQRDYMYVF